MKIILLHCTYRFLSFLTDRTKGFSLFSRWKIALGSLLIGANVMSCKQQAAESTQSGAKPEKDTVTDLSTCYVSNPVKDSIDKKGNSSSIQPMTDVIFCYVDIDVVETNTNTFQEITWDEPELPYVVDELRSLPMCYMVSIESEMPQFKGGGVALRSFLEDNVKYPAVARDNKIQGVVLVEFVVTPDGSVDSITVIKSLDPDCDAEAVRVVKAMPKWEPAKKEGKAVKVYYQLPFIFSLE